MEIKYPNGVYIGNEVLFDYVQDGRASSGYSPSGLRNLVRDIKEKDNPRSVTWTVKNFNDYVVANKYTFTIPENFVWW
jgi:hypothetical protein